jgi:hypothetical protein
MAALPSAENRRQRFWTAAAGRQGFPGERRLANAALRAAQAWSRAESAAFAAQAAAIFAADCGESQELNRRNWRRCAVLDRLRQSIAGALDRIIDRWRRPRAR